MPDAPRLRSLLRDRWHLRPDQITSLPTGMLSRNWAVAAGGDRYVARLVDANGRQLLDPATGRAGLLDCGAGGTGPLIYDVAAAVIYAGGPDRAAPLLDGYLRAGPIGSDELSVALPVALRFRWAVQADRWARDGNRSALAGARAALDSMPS